MPIPSKPSLLRNVIGYDADVFSLPDTTVEGSGALSYESGWPRITGTSLKAGGKAPQREYFNQVNKVLSQHLFFLQSGNVYDWDASLNYNAGAHVLGSDGLEYVAVSPSGPDVPGVGAKDPAGSRNKSQWLLLAALLMSSDGGLVVDPLTGKGAVDFEQMPTDKFEALLKSIRVPIWLTKNKNFYVNGTTGSDTLDDGRGESEGKPFKTIQACVSYVCENYNIGPYNLIINVAAGVYAENLVIPEIARTTGTLFIWGHSQTDTIIETGNKATRQAATVKVEAFSRVDIRRFTIKAIDSKLNPGLENIYLDAFSSAKYAQVDIRECVLEGYQTTASENLDLNRVRVVSGEGGVALSAPIAIKGIYTALSKGNKISGIVIYTGGTIAIQGDTSTNTFEISGDFLYTVNASGGFIARNINSKPVVSGEATGKRYYCTDGGGISTAGGGPDYFPGSTAGTVQTETYSWYS